MGGKTKIFGVAVGKINVEGTPVAAIVPLGASVAEGPIGVERPFRHQDFVCSLRYSTNGYRWSVAAVAHREHVFCAEATRPQLHDVTVAAGFP